MTFKKDLVWQSETQRKIFRDLLYCMSLPGEIANLSHIGNFSALLGVLATLLDSSVSWSDEEGLLNKRDRHLLQTPIASSKTAQFVVKDATKPPQNDFFPSLGELSNPEKGATLILQGQALGIGDISLQLAGPGIKETRLVNISGFDQQWFIRRQEWVEDFPLGVDIILVDSTLIMALPRTTKLQFM